MSEPLIVITDPRNDRYFSQRLIPWWDQDLLAKANVLVVGAGALGNEVLKNLALLGIGGILVVDFDRIEAGNLTRSVLFRAKDSGRSKAQVVEERLRELNPDVRVRAFHSDIVREIGLGVFRRVDVVIGCLDNIEARWAVNRACWRVGKPWVDGGLNSLSGSVKVFIPPDGACYECGLTEQDRRWMALRYSCPNLHPSEILDGKIPTVVTSAAIVAGIQTQEALKLLHGLPVQPGGGLLYDGQATRALAIRQTRHNGCPAHEKYEPIVESPASARRTTLADILSLAEAQIGEPAQLVLDWVVVTNWRCLACSASHAVMRRWDYRLDEIPHCPNCGGKQFPEITHRIDRNTPWLDVPLAQVGVPPLDIVTAKKGDRAVFLELSDDRDEVMRL